MTRDESASSSNDARLGMTCVSVHDVARATWPACRKLIEAIEAVAPIPLTLLVVPRYRDAPAPADFLRWLETRVARGDELAAHGWTHQDAQPVRGLGDYLKRRIYTAGEGEFAALSADEAAFRIERAYRWFAVHGWPVRLFVPPAWLMGAAAGAQLARSPFAYAATRTRFLRLSDQGVVPCTSLVFSTRASWRRGLSLVWNPVVAAAGGKSPLVRFELHPPDAAFPAIRQQWSALLARSLAMRPASGVSQALDRLPEPSWRDGPVAYSR